MDRTKDFYEKAAKPNSDYPLATIAYYGPDDQFASKVVVGILWSEASQQADESHRWFAKGGVDVRQDQSILPQILDYIQSSGARRVVLADHILGCPHEEGIDYPEGEDCPQCPFWADRDRGTGETLT